MSSGTSYNGWPANSDPDAINVQNFGDAQGFPFPGGVRGGDVFTVLGYVATQLHERVEPCINGWCWGWTYKQNVNNPSQLSCHASATAIDWNAPDHPNGSSGTFSDAQRGVIYAILDEVQGAVSWLEGYDEMHFEICVNASDLAAIAANLPDAPTTPTDEDEMKDSDYDEIARRVWDRIIQPDGANSPAWALLVQARNLGDANSWADGRPEVLNGQSRDEALAQTRNDVSALKNG